MELVAGGAALVLGVGVVLLLIAAGRRSSPPLPEDRPPTLNTRGPDD